MSNTGQLAIHSDTNTLSTHSTIDIKEVNDFPGSVTLDGSSLTTKHFCLRASILLLRRIFYIIMYAPAITAAIEADK